MRFLDFRQKFESFNLITYQDVINAFGNVNQAQFATWKKDKYIKSVKKGMYVLSSVDIDNMLLANEMNDSYISLEFALSYHQVIPEITTSVTSVSNNRNEEIDNDFGIFYYHKIASKLFNGFYLIDSPVKRKRKIRIATKEKALFDLVYFRTDLKSHEDFESLRLNCERVDLNEFKKFVDLVEATQTKKRLNNFIKYLNAII